MRRVNIAQLRRAISGLIERLPEPLSVRLRPRRYRYAIDDTPPPLPELRASTRLLIAHANYAGQGWMIARAAESLPDVAAYAVHLEGRNALFGFHSDMVVPDSIYQHSAHWRRRFFQEVSERFTHVIVESGRPLFGRLNDFDVARDVDALQSAGVAVAAHAHGSELRLPSRHGQLDEWSPFNPRHGVDESEIVRLETVSRRFRDFVAQSGVPLTVSTPDLLADYPTATWLPLVVDVARWASNSPVLDHQVPRVIHIPTRSHVKGTALIEPTMTALHDEGLVTYHQLQGLPFAEMPSVISNSDIVLEQFRIGTYSVAAVEAMAAGRLVIVHLHDQVRRAVRDATGLEIPIVSATPATLEAVLRDVVARPELYREIAAQGPKFVRTVHDGGLSAASLAPFLGRA